MYFFTLIFKMLEICDELNGQKSNYAVNISYSVMVVIRIFFATRIKLSVNI
jgi:hypothetical protein